MTAGAHTAGVDLGGTKIQTVVLCNEEVVGSARVLTPQTGAADDVIAAIAAAVREALAAAGASSGTLRALGIGTPGAVDSATGTVTRAINVPGFAERVELGPRLARALGGIRVVVDNDVQVGVRGEHQRGAGRPFRNLLGVWVGTGVGGGLVLDGAIYEGAGAAGEIGHMIAKPDGRLCSCGRRGCVEAYAGRAAMERHARARVERGQKTSLFRIMAEKGRAGLSSGVYAKALEQGDRLTEELIGEAVWALGLGIASAQNLLSLEAVIIGGGLGDRLGRPFADRIAAEVQRHLFVPDRPPAVLTTELGDLAGAVGAAVLAGG